MVKDKTSMKKNRLSIIYTIIILFFCSCIKETDLTIDTYIKRPFVYSIITQNDFTIELLWTKDPLSEDQFKPIENAQISAYKNNNLIGTLKETDSGKYILENYTGQIDEKYSIEIIIPNWEDTIYAETTLPNKPSYSIEIEKTDTSNYEINLHINDKSSQNNYYAINQSTTYYCENKNFLTPNYLNTINFNDYVSSDNSIIIENKDEIDRYSLNCFYNNVNEYREYNQNNTGDELMHNVDSLLIISQFRQLNADLYEYLEDKEKYQIIKEGYNNNQKNIYSNIINGLGIFTSCYLINENTWIKKPHN